MTDPRPAATDPSSLLHAALRLHLDNRLDEAEVLYRQIIDQAPDHPQALGMLAMILADRPGDGEAEIILKRHLALRPTDGASLHRLGRLRAGQGDDEAAVALFRQAAQWLPRLAPIHNDLGVSLRRLGRRDEALAALDQAVTTDPVYGVAHGNRGVVLHDLGRFAEALAAHQAALAYISPASPEARASTLHNLAKAARKCGDRDAVAAACEAVLATNPKDAETVDELALLLEELGRGEEALDLRNTAARRAGVRRAGAGQGAQATVLLIGGVGAGHLPTRYLVDTSLFETLSVGLLSPDQPDAPLGAVTLAQLEAADVVFNTLGEVDKQGGQFEAVTALCARLGKPVLNPPSAIPRTGRDQAAILFGDIEHMVTPAVRWTDPARLANLELDGPTLVRPPGDHGGENLSLLRDAGERDAYLAAAKRSHDRLLLTAFHDFRSADGYWRKYRMIFVDRQVHPYHLAIGDDWLVHYWRAEMAAADWKKAEEERFLADWRGVFGPRAAAAVEEAARRLDLDYGGMDCALLSDGRLLLFEANACILLHLDEPAAAFPYKHRYVPPIRDAFSQMIRERAGRG
jgi:tetratricopeptide (TPR) repeat protein